MERLPDGRFGLGNRAGLKGGPARSASLSSERKSEIARSGWDARVQRHFDGNYDAARQYMRELGQWSYEQQVGDLNLASRRPHPGTAAEFMARYYQLQFNFTGGTT